MKIESFLAFEYLMLVCRVETEKASGSKKSSKSIEQDLRAQINANLQKIKTLTSEKNRITAEKSQLEKRLEHLTQVACDKFSLPMLLIVLLKHFSQK